jgi:hypothetical protein
MSIVSAPVHRLIESIKTENGPRKILIDSCRNCPESYIPRQAFGVDAPDGLLACVQTSMIVDGDVIDDMCPLEFSQ